MATLEDFIPSILNSTASDSSSTITTIAITDSNTTTTTTTTAANNCTPVNHSFDSSTVTTAAAVSKALETSSTCSASTVDSIVDKLVNSLDLNDTLLAKDWKSVSSRSSSVAGSLTLGFGGGNMFSEVFESNVLESGSLEDSSCSLGEGGVEKNCKICR